jgi:pimeloyl-ACP methyl ester carboxylesterase
VDRRPRGLPEERALPTSDPEPRVFDRRAGRLAYVDEGPKGRPVFVTLHGIPGSARDFRYLAPALTALGLRLVRVDLPGFGGSAPDEAAMRSLRVRGHAVLELADHLGLDRFGLIGHSMGGGPALLLAARERERVSHLALLASVGLRPHRALGRGLHTFRLLGRLLGWPGVGPLLAPMARAGYRRRRFPGAEAMRARDFAAHFRAIGALDFRALQAAVRSGLPPTLVAWSRDDHLVQASIQEELVAGIPGARALCFDVAGHNLQKSRAPEIAKALAQLAAAAP